VRITPEGNSRRQEGEIMSEHIAAIDLLAIRLDASTILRKADAVATNARILRSLPAWPTEAVFTLEMARDHLEQALAGVNDALAEFDGKPLDSPAPTQEVAQEYRLTFSQAAE
jgi:hypothetical protein